MLHWDELNFPLLLCRVCVARCVFRYLCCVCFCYCFYLFVVVLFFIVLCFMPNISRVSELFIIDWPFVFLYVYLIPVLICFVVQACAYCIIQLKPFLARFIWVVVEILTLLIYTENMSITPKLKSSIDHRNALRYTT